MILNQPGAPGVYTEQVYPQVSEELRTGVPVFLGVVEKKDVDAHPETFALVPLSTPGLWLVRAAIMDQENAGRNKNSGIRDDLPEKFAFWPEFERNYGLLRPYGYLVYAVRGFFENDGHLCYVQIVCFEDSVSIDTAIKEGLKTLETIETIDLVCVPDIMFPHQPDEAYPDPGKIWSIQAEILNHCDKVFSRFAILDSPPGVSPEGLKSLEGKLSSPNGALYYPWVRLADTGFVPPCGHIAGIYARTDRQVGVHKAPANEILEGVLDLEVNLTNVQQEDLNTLGVNCLRIFPGRGILVWGARTLAGEEDPEWSYVSVRRLFITIGGWIERRMADAVFEPNDATLWERIKRELNSHLNDLFLKGALKGQTAQEAFFVKCDAETNTVEVRDAGMVITRVGLALTVPCEFIVVRIIHGVGGITVTPTPALPATPISGKLTPSKPIQVEH